MDTETIRKATIREITEYPAGYGAEIEDGTYVLSDEAVDGIIGQFRTETDTGTVSDIVYHDVYIAMTMVNERVCRIDLSVDCDYELGHIDYDHGDHRDIAPSSEYRSHGKAVNDHRDYEIFAVADANTLGDIMDDFEEMIIADLEREC